MTESRDIARSAENLLGGMGGGVTSWPIQAEDRTDVVESLMKITNDEKVSARDRIRAAEALAKLSAQNADTGIPQLHLHQHNGTSAKPTLEQRKANIARRIETLKRMRRQP